MAVTESTSVGPDRAANRDTRAPTPAGSPKACHSPQLLVLDENFQGPIPINANVARPAAPAAARVSLAAIAVLDATSYAFFSLRAYCI